MFKKWVGGAKKHGGLGNAMTSQVQQWVEPVVEQVQKIEGGAEKHGGLGNAMVAQINVWTAPDNTPEDQELETRRSLEETRKRDAEDLERAIELSKREAQELLARREAQELLARKEAEELLARKEAEELLARKEAEELETRRLLEEVARKKEAEDLERAIELSKREAQELLAKENEQASNSVESSTNQSWSVVNVSSSVDGKIVTIRLKLDVDEINLIGDGGVTEDGGAQ